MSAGTFNRWVQFQVFVGVDDGAGGQNEAEGWKPYVALSASVIPLSGMQLLQAGLLQTEITHRIACWYREDLLGERRALRALSMDGQLYAIRAIRDVDGRRITLECDAVQVSRP